MKTKYIVLILCAFFFTSCFEDKGNYKYAEVDDIKVDGIASRYIVLSYVDKLNIPVTLNTQYTDLEYAWYIYNPKKETEYNHDKEYQAELISTDKDLSCDVGWEPGIYTVMVKVTSKSNNYAVYAQTSVEVVTQLSRGFYILKETNDGNTELDLYYKEGEPVAADLLRKGLGEPMQGKPLHLGVVYSHGYINKETDEVKHGNTACVTTEKGEIGFFNTDNMVKVHDDSDIRFGGLEDGEIPVTAFTFGVSNFYISNKAIAGAYTSNMMPASTGAFGTTSGTGASRFFVQDGDMSIIYWNEKDERFDYADQYSFGHGFFGDYDENGFSTKGMKCISCGSSYASSTVGTLIYFLMEDASGKKFLYYIEAVGGTPTTTRRVELPAASKLANASYYATNSLTATYLYYIYDNKLYVYNLNGDVEDNTPIQLTGISDETITYLSYQFMDSKKSDAENNFTHLVVGTQKGNTYRVRMYDIVGGVPRDLVKEFSGDGRLVMVNYVSPKFAIGGDLSFPN